MDRFDKAGLFGEDEPAQSKKIIWITGMTRVLRGESHCFDTPPV